MNVQYLLASVDTLSSQQHYDTVKSELGLLIFSAKDTLIKWYDYCASSYNTRKLQWYWKETVDEPIL